MFTFDTTDQKEVRRLRIAQFNGRIATVTSGESTITGHVRSVQERQSGVHASWSITLVPTERRTSAAVRPISRIPVFAEDRC